MSRQRNGMWPTLSVVAGKRLPEDETAPVWATRYDHLLEEYLAAPDEAGLMAIGKLGRDMVWSRLPPETAAEIHDAACRRWLQRHPQTSDGFLPLFTLFSTAMTEMLTPYGMVFRELLEHEETNFDMRQHYQQIRHALGDTVEAISKLRETSDPYTSAHQQRVALLACAIAKQLGLDEDRVEGLRLAAEMHDIGMVQVPKNILAQSGHLDDSEYEMVKAHPRIGFNVLKEIEFPWPVANITLQHHERVDGSGYPQGLRGDDILLEARIISVADTVEAMVSHRPYRSSLDIDTALAEIRANSGSYYDAMVVETCCDLFDEHAFAFPN